MPQQRVRPRAGQGQPRELQLYLKGSDSCTSSAAPRIRPSFSAWVKAFSSTSPPRAVFTRNAPCLICTEGKCQLGALTPSHPHPHPETCLQLGQHPTVRALAPEQPPSRCTQVFHGISISGWCWQTKPTAAITSAPQGWGPFTWQDTAPINNTVGRHTWMQPTREAEGSLASSCTQALPTKALLATHMR